MSAEFKYIVRLLGRDLIGTSNVVYALTRIKGVNIRMANAIAKKADINPEKRMGFLSDNEIKKIDNVLNDIEKQDLPSWLFNRRKDMDSGKDLHVVASDLDLQIKTDKEGMMAIKSWRGYRHAYGLKVRGQRTRTTSRKGKIVGVRKKRGV